MTFTYQPQGVCSRQIIMEIEDNMIRSIQFVGGCAGNLMGIKSLVEGQDIDEVIAKLDGIQCGFRGTSCPDQLAQALKQAKEEM